VSDMGKRGKGESSMRCLWHTQQAKSIKIRKKKPTTTTRKGSQNIASDTWSAHIYRDICAKVGH